MPHAEASNFALGISKQEAFRQLLEAMRGLVDGQSNWICNLANASSLLWHMYHSLGGPSSSVNWAGFYVVDRKSPEQLILGPFHGKVACQTIRIGKGVCGAAAWEGRTILLQDVATFPGHIACDGESKSEIVTPIKHGEKVGLNKAENCGLVAELDDQKVVGVIDIDCADLQGFDSTDQEGLEELAKLLSASCDWDDF